MKLGIMQPYFFPYIAYWQLMNIVDNYVIYDDVNYIKGGWINRNRILMNNNPSYFNIQTIGASSNKKINEVGVDNSEIIKNKMIKTLEQSYIKAPYYEETIGILKEIILFDENNLAKYLINSITKLAKYLDMDTNFIISSDLKKDNDLKGKDKVIHICKVLKATDYYNAIGGQELYNIEEFKENNIKLHFVKTNTIEYKQLKNEFISNLSIIDVLMFNGKEETKKLLNSYELID